MSELESIGKLREWSHRYDNAWSPLSLACYGDNYGEAIRSMIDAIEAEIAERFIELPVDADGDPIRPGDLIEFGGKGECLSVTHVGWTERKDPTIAYRRPNGTIDCSCIGTECRHVKPRTLEDVLRDFVHKSVRIGMVGGIPADTKLYADEDAIAEFADEIRAMFGEEADE